MGRFPAPLPVARLGRVLVAGLTMAVVVQCIDSVLSVSAPAALAILIPSGVATYAAMCWLQNVGPSARSARWTRAQGALVKSNAVNLAIATSGSAGWKTVRTRWRRISRLRTQPPSHRGSCPPGDGRDRTLRAKSIGHALAGRAAARAAIEAGAEVVLLSTLQNAPFVPLPRGCANIVYGDCTTAQPRSFTAARDASFFRAPSSTRGSAGCRSRMLFSVHVEWYRDALRAELGVSEDRLVLLPFYVDTTNGSRWNKSR